MLQAPFTGLGYAGFVADFAGTLPYTAGPVFPPGHNGPSVRAGGAPPGVYGAIASPGPVSRRKAGVPPQVAPGWWIGGAQGGLTYGPRIR